MRPNPFLVRVLGIVGPRRHIQNCRLAVAVAWRKSVVNAGRDGQKLRVIGGKDHGLRLACGRIKKADLGSTSYAIPPIPLESVAMPRLDDACRGRGDVSLSKSVRVIGVAEYLREPAALVQASGKWAKLG